MFNSRYIHRIFSNTSCKIRLKPLNLKRFESTSTVFDGRECSRVLLASLKKEVESWTAEGNRNPRLAVVIAGEDPASLSYIRMKSRAATTVGIHSEVYQLKHEINQNELIKIIHDLNRNDEVDGILVQLPLPAHLDEYAVSNSISPDKDVDGFTETNMGKLCMNSSVFIPCTAMAVYNIIRQTGIETSGKHALVCGRSKHVGLPIVLMLHSSCYIGNLRGLNMTTTLCHRHTPKEQLVKLSRKADVIVSAAGVPGLITGDMIKNGAIVIDVGMMRIRDLNEKTQFIGDIAFDDVKEKAAFITPVPGGVGPVTVAMLMHNTLQAAKINQSSSKLKLDIN